LRAVDHDLVPVAAVVVLSILYWALLVAILTSDVLAGALRKVVVGAAFGMMWLVLLMMPGCYVPFILAMSAVLLHRPVPRASASQRSVSTRRRAAVILWVLAIAISVLLLILPSLMAR
jgi:hypothetical protein